MRETQQSIAAWAKGALPSKLQTVDAITAKANDEMSELVRDILTGESRQKVGEEVADVVIPLFQLCQSLGLDLLEQVDRKMSIVRGREYTPDGKRVDKKEVV